MIINSLGELTEICEKELNQKIAKRIVKDKNKNYNKGLAKAIVNRWNQQLDNETEEEFKDRVGEFWIRKEIKNVKYIFLTIFLVFALVYIVKLLMGFF